MGQKTGWEDELKDLLKELKNAESTYANYESKIAEMEATLHELKCELTSEGVINGKNDVIRESQFFPHAKPYLERHRRLKDLARNSKVELNYWKRLYDAKYSKQLSDKTV